MRADGNKLLMVAQELLMTLFGLLFAFPHIPDRILDDGSNEHTWFSVTSLQGFQAAVENLLQTSGVLEVSLAPGKRTEDITIELVADLGRLSALFDLGLVEDGGDVPASCRQMYEHIVALFGAMLHPNVVRNRDDLFDLYQQRGFVPRGKEGFPQLAPNRPEGSAEDSVQQARSALLEFAERLTVHWLQPYFASAKNFYLPEQMAAACQS